MEKTLKTNLLNKPRTLLSHVGARGVPVSVRHSLCPHRSHSVHVGPRGCRIEQPALCSHLDHHFHWPGERQDDPSTAILTLIHTHTHTCTIEQEEKPSGVRPTRKVGGCLPLVGPRCPQIDPRSIHRMQGEVVSAKSLPLPGPGPAPQPRVKTPSSPDSLLKASSSRDCLSLSGLRLFRGNRAPNLHPSLPAAVAQAVQDQSHACS